MLRRSVSPPGSGAVLLYTVPIGTSVSYSPLHTIHQLTPAAHTRRRSVNGVQYFFAFAQDSLRKSESATGCQQGIIITSMAREEYGIVIQRACVLVNVICSLVIQACRS